MGFLVSYNDSPERKIYLKKLFFDNQGAEFWVNLLATVQ